MKLIQIHDLYDRAGRRRKLVVRFTILSLGAFFLAQVVPTLADEQSRVVELEAQLSASPSATPSPESTTSSSASPAPTDDSTPITSSSPATNKVETRPVKLAPSQGMTIQFPTSVSVDPRSQVTDLPKFKVVGPQYLLVCAIADGAIIDALTRGLPDVGSAQNLYLSGDLSPRMVISGETTLVLDVMNSGQGLRISGLGRKLSSTRVHFSFVATDGIARSDELCTYTKFGNDRMLSFRPIGVGLGLKKGEVNLG